VFPNFISFTLLVSERHTLTSFSQQFEVVTFTFSIQGIILLVVLYGFETWSLTLREERRLRVFENRALRRIFGPKRDEVTGECMKLHNEELNDLYPHQIFGWSNLED